MKKELMSGNQAIARGAFEAGITFASGYPGTPSTEIMEEFAQYEGVYAEWAPNEKVGLEVAIGAALANTDAMATMKHVGVNVAADPLFTVAYTGIEGGLVIITADDPSMHSSQNEQDNRNYAKFAKIPMLEPANPQEAKDFVKIALNISRKFDTPVFLRSTTRLSHSKAPVSKGNRVTEISKPAIKIDTEKYVMVPVNARKRRLEVEKRLNALKAFAEKFPENTMEINDTRVGIISAGVAYEYAKDSFPNYSYLKLGMVYPLPENLIREFSQKVKKIYVVEEMDPFLEEQIKAMGIKNVSGKEIFPFTKEFDPGIIKDSIQGNEQKKQQIELPEIPPRPPNMCPGCPHRGLFYSLKKCGKVFVNGDIGCYTLSFLKPLEGLHNCVCMGASIGMAHGMSKALGDEGKGKVVAVLGDSTFLHSGITPLLNMVYNKSNALVIICDNRTTAMTGMQEHPATGFTLQREKTKAVDFIKLAESLGVDSVRVADPYDLAKTTKTIKEELSREGVSLIVSQRACVLFKRAGETAKPSLRIDLTKCTGCKVCLPIGCPAISWQSFSAINAAAIQRNAPKQDGFVVIDTSLCNGCSICQQICKFDAIID
ncbi:MAG: indolepyruvate ferredoxin oxidoreductase subunit alpha [Deltaproteobacteria bacterium]|nr:indolepyruvate ferredoxin oxidoreductase subunit alpha [Deltaproteobacteria bacterium]